MMFLSSRRQAIGRLDDNADDDRGCGNVREIEDERDAEATGCLISM